MTLESEDNNRNYHVVCVDPIGFKSFLDKKEDKLIKTAVNDFYRSVHYATQHRYTNETTCQNVIGDSVYFTCEKLETALNFVISFGNDCIGTAIDLFKGRIIYTPFMARGGVAFGPVSLSFSDCGPNRLLGVSFQKQTDGAFNAVGLPVDCAHKLSGKLKGIRVAIHDSVNVRTDDYKKYFSEVTYSKDEKDYSCYEFLWPLYIFERKDQGYIQKSLDAFWDLYGKNRGKHEIHYSSTLSLLWKSVDKIPGCTAAEEFFETKDSDQVNEINNLKGYIK